MPFAPFCFFLRRCRALRCPQPFLRFANQLAHSAVRHFSPHLYEFFNQMSEDFLPQSRLFSTAEKAVHRLIRRKVMRKLTPLTAGLNNVQHGVCQFALAPLPIPHSRIQWLYFFPLAVCQVRRVRLAPCSYFFHAAIIPCFTYEDKLLYPQARAAGAADHLDCHHGDVLRDALDSGWTVRK